MTSAQKKVTIAAAVVAGVFLAGILVSQRIPETISAPLFVLVIIVEVIIAPIPGGAIGYLGAARFGFWHAWLLLYIGNVIGTFVVFTLAREYGAPRFQEKVSARTREWYNRLLDGNAFLLWLAYSVPVLPLDVLSVLAGLSRLSKRRFFVTAFTGFLVYTGIVAYVGSSLAHLIGATEAVSAIGAVFVALLVYWLWKCHRRRNSTESSSSRD